MTPSGLSPDAAAQLPAPGPRPTGFEVPQGACDCHVHVFGPPQRYPLRPESRYEPPAVDLGDYLQVQETLGLGRAVVVQPDVYLDNQVTLDALEASGGAWRGVVRLHGAADDLPFEAFHAAGVRGIRLDGRKPGGLDAVGVLARRLAPLGWHVQVHLLARDLPGLLPVLDRLPVPLVLDHFARVDLDGGLDQPGFRAVLDLLSTGRCWVKLSAAYRFSDPLPPYPRLREFAQTLVAAAPDRMLWGSDWPHTSHAGFMPDDGTLLDLLQAWVPDRRIRDSILRDNPAALYGFPATPEGDHP